jgi:hypothetical protein
VASHEPIKMSMRPATDTAPRRSPSTDTPRSTATAGLTGGREHAGRAQQLQRHQRYGGHEDGRQRGADPALSERDQEKGRDDFDEREGGDRSDAGAKAS